VGVHFHRTAPVAPSIAKTSPSGATCVYCTPFATTAFDSIEPHAASCVLHTPRLMCHACLSVATFDLVICVSDE
jgi:hypothetical protein